MKPELTEDNFNRLAKSIMKKHGCNYNEANARLESLQLNIICGDSIRNSLPQQVALLTAINSGKRAFLGGININIPANTPCLITWPNVTSLNEACNELGAKENAADDKNNFTIYLGIPGNIDENSLQVVCNSWQGGILIDGEYSPLDAEGKLPLGGIAAAAIAVGTAFLRMSGLEPEAGNRPAGISLWRPDLHWLEILAEGPEDVFLPKRCWILGLGHLGQAYLWNLAFLPYKSPDEVQILLQDYDKMAEGNWSAGLLCESNSINCYKTRVCSSWLENRKFRTTATERKFDENTIRYGEEPFVALCGFDSSASRSVLGDGGFDFIIESALGSNTQLFDKIILHTFPNGDKTPENIWGLSANADIENDSEDFKLFSDLRGEDCGILADTLANKAISSSFVGAFAGSLVISEFIRGLNGGSRYDIIRIQVRDSQHVNAIPNVSSKYTTEFARNGFLEAS